MSDREPGQSERSDDVQRLISTGKRVEKSAIVGSRTPNKRSLGPIVGIGLGAAALLVVLALYLSQQRPAEETRLAQEQAVQEQGGEEQGGEDETAEQSAAEGLSGEPSGEERDVAAERAESGERVAAGQAEAGTGAGGTDVAATADTGEPERQRGAEASPEPEQTGPAAEETGDDPSGIGEAETGGGRSAAEREQATAASEADAGSPEGRQDQDDGSQRVAAAERGPSRESRAQAGGTSAGRAADSGAQEGRREPPPAHVPQGYQSVLEQLQRLAEEGKEAPSPSGQPILDGLLSGSEVAVGILPSPADSAAEGLEGSSSSLGMPSGAERGAEAAGRDVAAQPALPRPGEGAAQRSRESDAAAEPESSREGPGENGWAGDQEFAPAPGPAPYGPEYSARTAPTSPEGTPQAGEDQDSGEETSARAALRQQSDTASEGAEAEQTEAMETKPEQSEVVQAETEQPESLSPMVRVPGGTVRFGAPPSDTIALENEKPQIEVEVDAFRIETHEVTNRQYEAFLEDTGYEPVPRSDDPTFSRYNWDPETRSYPENLGNYPVVNVSRADARAYARWAGRRLPTETEWEAAARQGSDGGLYPWGNAYADRVFANFDAERLVPVRRYQPNQFGIYDLAGNAFEWVQDAFDADIHETYSAETYPPRSGEFGLLKGGAFYSTFREIRISYRENNYPDVRYFGYGFRLAADVEESE